MRGQLIGHGGRHAKLLPPTRGRVVRPQFLEERLARGPVGVVLQVLVVVGHAGVVAAEGEYVSSVVDDSVAAPRLRDVPPVHRGLGDLWLQRERLERVGLRPLLFSQHFVPLSNAEQKLR